MENLLEKKGRGFRCKIHGVSVDGRIQVEDGWVYLCQNGICGTTCQDRWGYLYSWHVMNGSEESLASSGVTDFELTGEDSDSVELSFAEIAAMLNVPIEKLRIKY